MRRLRRSPWAGACPATSRITRWTAPLRKPPTVQTTALIVTNSLRIRQPAQDEHFKSQKIAEIAGLEQRLARCNGVRKSARIRHGKCGVLFRAARLHGAGRWGL